MRKRKMLFAVFFMCAMVFVPIQAWAFTQRTSAPSSTNWYYTTGNIFHTSGFGMPNCTAYAFGRAYELLGKEPKLCHNDAGQWWNYNKSHSYYSYGSEPKLGAIACWSGNPGHVAVVEEINGNNVTISESHWGGTYWNRKTINKNGSYGNLGFQGYIYIGDWEQPPSNITIKADKTEIAVGDTVNFTYTINNATSKHVGIDFAGGSRYHSITLNNSSGSVSYTFTQPGTYCVITEGSNEKGYNCCNGVYISVSNTSPSNITIKANQTEIAVGDTVNFTYTINNATAKCIGIDSDGKRYHSIALNNSSGSVSYTFTQPGTYCVITEGYNAKGYNCCNGVYISVSNQSPENITIKADKTEIAVGDTVNFTYTINNATSKHVGIDFAGGSRYHSIALDNSSGSVSYTFTQPGTYCVITEGYNAKGYNCCNGIYISVIDSVKYPFTVTKSSAFANITNNTSSSQTANVIIAQYNNGTLQNMKSETITFAAKEAKLFDASGEYKIFVWDDLNSMRPLAR